MEIRKEFSLNNKYSVSLKKELVEQVLSGKLSKSEASAHYGVSWMSVNRWLNKFGHEVLEASGISQIRLKSNREVSNTVKMDEKEVRRLAKQVQELEKQLKEAELRAQVYDKMIDVAERELNISIRKKFVTKQSKKSKK
jgi:transposase